MLAQLMQMSIPSKTICPKLAHDGLPSEWMEAYKKKELQKKALFSRRFNAGPVQKVEANSVQYKVQGGYM